MTRDGGRVRDRRGHVRTRALVALGAGAAVLVGVTAGTTLALWHDEATVTGRVPTGVVVLGVGAPAATGTLTDYADGPTDTVEFTFGAVAATTLDATGSVAVPFQVDALAEGRRSLTYTITPDITTGSIFADAQIRIVKVPRASCAPGVAGPDTRVSTPVTGTVPDQQLVSEQWCLVATYQRLQGTYSNTAEVEAEVTVPGGATAPPVSDHSSWSAQVLKGRLPALEPTHRVTVGFTTSRAAG